ncbi:MAG: protein kinase [Candidatus Latescibacteria bacterium]|nr:protein kinase [Candidatus Latescibacterota bacterium]NIO28472.1 protein kinase [Candidatus Latescibacterota bacterium]NIO56021.1 protein kinase [Candidatus Latescibacterota bacterium]NIT01985.1 protein kinase [Candidatus Latescibacterota bacterium]
MIGRTISHYKILEKLGEGGMSVVYKAEDTKLKRTVALKFLPPHALGSEDEKRRFLREAQAAAGLDHPNICTIYEINEVEDQTFIAMPYVDGMDLRHRIEQGPFKVETALEVSIQIAEGLQAAHERGIIHRDIKSANIMFTGRGQPKIMDFGLAKSMDWAQVSKEGTTVGTVAYMSPEQSGGEAVDHRTDIWSLGVVMYEMLTGNRPFRGDYEQAVIYSIVNEEPEPVTAVRTGVPVEFERLIFKALAKNPKHRYQDMEDLLVDLRRLKAELDSKELLSRSGIRVKHRKSRVSAVLIPSLLIAAVAIVAVYFLKFQPGEAEGAPIPIAVADFENETNEPELDGLSGMLITSLEQSRMLSVLTRDRMFDYLDQMDKNDVTRIDERMGREICREANVNVLIAASIRRFDELYTIDLKAYDLRENKHLFAAKEEGRGKASIPSMIDKLAKKTREELNEQSVAIQRTSENIADVTTPNLEAYQQYFLGEQYINQLKHKEAREAFQRAIELDSTFALAHYRLAYASWWGHEPEDLQRAQLQRALALVQRLPEKHRYLLRAQNAVAVEGLQEGVKILKEMEKIYPNEHEMIYNIGDYSYHLEEYEQAEKYLKRALEMVPKHERALNHLTVTYRAMKDYDKGIEIAKRYADVTRSPEAYALLSDFYINKGEYETALNIAKETFEQHPESFPVANQIVRGYLMKGEYTDAEAILEPFTSDSMDAKVRQGALNMLEAVCMYKGRYRDALSTADRNIEGFFEAGDSISAAQKHITKAFVYAMGWNDVKSAEAELAKALQYQDKFAFSKKSTMLMYDPDREYWMNIACISALLGRAEEAERIIEERLSDSKAVWIAQFLVHGAKGEYENAAALADTILTSGQDWQKQIVHFQLGEMQYENGELDRALVSIDGLHESGLVYGPRALLYPISMNLLGKIHEKKGDSRAAIRSYEKLVSLWKDADPDLPLLQETKSRLASLREAETQ